MAKIEVELTPAITGVLQQEYLKREANLLVELQDVRTVLATLRGSAPKEAKKERNEKGFWKNKIVHALGKIGEGKVSAIAEYIFIYDGSFRDLKDVSAKVAAFLAHNRVKDNTFQHKKDGKGFTYSLASAPKTRTNDRKANRR